MNYKKLESRLEDILELRPIEKTQRISDVADEYDLKESDVKDELKEFEKRKRENIKAEKEKGEKEDKERKAELKRLANNKKAETKAEEEKAKQDAKEQKEAKINAVKQETRSKMDSDFQYNISTLLATSQEIKLQNYVQRKHRKNINSIQPKAM